MVCFGAIRLAKYFLSVRETARVNEALAQLYEEQAPAAETTPQANEQPALPSEDNAPEEVETPAGFHSASGEVVEGFETLYAKNPDLVAWLKLPGVFSLPVVYRDNTYYLDHDFNGRKSDSGTLFLDVMHPLDAQSQYLIVHGHAMYDGSMFGYLTHYRNADYIRAHPNLYFTTMYQREVYEIVGVLFVSEEEMRSVVRLGTPRFESETEFADFIRGLRKKALHFTNQEIAQDDALLALSTCWKDGRIVALFKRVE